VERPLTVLVVTIALLLFLPSFGAPFTVPRLLALSIVAAIAASRANTREPPSPVWSVLVLWPLVTLFWVNDPLTRWHVVLWIGALVAVWSARPLDEGHRLRLREGIGWAGLATVVYLLVQTAGFDVMAYPPGTPPGSFFGNPNFTAHFLVLVLCLGQFRGPLCWLGTTLIVIGIALTGSKGAMAAAFVWALVRTTARVRWIALSAFLLLSCGAIWLYRTDVTEGARWLADPAAWSREHARQPLLIAERDPWFRGKRASVITRPILWGNTLQMIPEFSLIGAGAGDFRATYPAHASAWVPDPNLSQLYRPSSPHNWLLEAAVCLGVPWLVLLLVQLVRSYRRTSEDRTWWEAFALQAGIGLFSLTYLQPTIVLLLIATAPSCRSTVRGRPGLLAVPLVATMTFLGFWVDYRADTRTGTLFPANRAAQALEAGDLDTAWSAQKEAWRRDPLGPDTLFNLAVIAERRTESAMAIRVYTVVAASYPHYRPARQRLILLLGFEEAMARIAAHSGDPEGLAGSLAEELGAIR